MGADFQSHRCHRGNFRVDHGDIHVLTVNNAEEILALCARAESHPAQRERLIRRAAAFTGWADLPQQAEQHGLGPLVYVQLRAAGIEPPAPVQLALQGLYRRHRQADRAGLKGA